MSIRSPKHVPNYGWQLMRILVFVSAILMAVPLTAQDAKKALIFGITGQDGSYLAELLLEKGYEVHGVRRRTSTSNTGRLDHLLNEESEKLDGKLHLHYGDITDFASVMAVMQDIKPDEVYNLAAQSFVQSSFETPIFTTYVNALGPLHILEAIRKLDLIKKTRFYQASTSEMFGKVHEVPQKETTPFHPRSPYGVSKLFGHWITKNYREAYGIYACSGILFNHESPRRANEFVTKKIVRSIANILSHQQQHLLLGNLDAKRDWGYTRDFIEAMWLMLQQEKPDDYVVATGEMHTVREFVEEAFAHVGINIMWQGVGVDEIGVDQATGKILVRIDAKLFRPAEVDELLGNASKAHQRLGWTPHCTFKRLVQIMMQEELTRVLPGASCINKRVVTEARNNGEKVPVYRSEESSMTSA